LVGKDENAEMKTADKRRAWRSLPAHGTAILVAALLISAVLHLVSGERLSGVRPPPRTNANFPSGAIKVRIVQADPKAKKPEKKPPEPPAPSEVMPKILETPQVKTEKPTESSYVGNVDHTAKKETRVSEKVKRDKAKDPGQKGSPEAVVGVPQDKKITDAKMEARKPSTKPQAEKPEQATPKKSGPTVKGSSGSIAFDGADRKPRNPYEALLPTGSSDLPGQVNAGYQDYVDDKIEEGERIDINTTEYRFIGYFTNMRKAIELVWNYPLEASRKGLQGEVGLEFAIGKDGKASRVRVIKSSGYEVLDRAIVDAIRLASPFAPLPDGFGKNRILVTGSFRYILSSYGTH
jgi:protein TonB